MNYPSKKVDQNVSGWRIKYQLFSGILFIALGVVVFIRTKAYMNFFVAGLFCIALVGYGAYRIIMFVRLSKKLKEADK